MAPFLCEHPIDTHAPQNVQDAETTEWYPPWKATNGIVDGGTVYAQNAPW